jgi:uncharacterized repeat protein (TIGR03803 family)
MKNSFARLPIPVATALIFAGVAIPALAASIGHVKRDAAELLYDFRGGSDGKAPMGGVVADVQGNLYGTTMRGGPSNFGTVFKLSPTKNGYAESILYAFTSTSGKNPVSGLNIDSIGNLFGTTQLGGGSQTSGTAFELAASPSGYQFQLLEAFTLVNSSGDTPLAGLTPDGRGNYFGTTSEGGFCLGGTVFEFSPTFNVIHNFGCDNNVQHAAAPVTIGPNGTIFGTTEYGGDGPCPKGCGIVYELMPGSSGYTKRTVHTFEGGQDGAYPVTPVTFGSDGTIFGTTSAGGAANDGTVYALTPNKNKYTETVLYAFQGGTDGVQPLSGVTIVRGKLYGTTRRGGAYNDGAIYRLTPFHGAYTESIVQSFYVANGLYPVGDLLFFNGALYGTTSNGGRHGPFGTVFRFKP